MPPTVANAELQIQRQSHGIKPDLYAAGWHTCHFSDYDINARDEEYYFPCSNDKQCCGRECCTPVAGAFPAWLAWLIGILLFLLLLLLTLCLLYYCCRRRKRVSPPPSPRPPPVVVHKTPGVQTYRRVPSEGTLRRISDSNLYELRSGSGGGYTPSGTNTVTTVVTVDSSNGYGSSTSGDRHPRRTRSRRRRRRDWVDDMHDDLDFPEPPFVPSPMRESYESSPTPIRISYHDEAEFTQERRPLVSRIQTPEEQKARSIYYRPGTDRVASYNELPK